MKDSWHLTTPTTHSHSHPCLHSFICHVNKESISPVSVPQYSLIDLWPVVEIRYGLFIFFLWTSDSKHFSCFYLILIEVTDAALQLVKLFESLKQGIPE